MSKHAASYGRHTGDEDVKIYKGKTKAESPKSVNKQPGSTARKSIKRRDAKVYRELNTKAIVLPLVTAIVLAVVWLLPTTGWIRTLSFLIPYIMAGFDVLMEALEKILNKKIMEAEVIMTVASIAAFCIGEYPAAVLVMLIFRIGELAEAFAVGRSRKALEKIMDIRPSSANVETAEGVLAVELDYVNVGDIIVVEPGEKIPLDGIIIEGVTSIDTSPLTGDSESAAVTVGHKVVSGCINITSPIRVQVSHSYGDSTVSKVLGLVEKAAEHKSRQEATISRFAKIYTPVMLVLALALAIVPPIFNGHWAEYIRCGIIFLAVSCPCALVISVPLAYFCGIGCAAENGVIVKGSDYLETMAKADTFVFDKTGTITEGRFAITDVFPEEISEHELLSIAATAESSSRHPIARCLRQASGTLSLPDSQSVNTEEIPGRGVKADIGGRQVLVGNAALLEENGVGYKVPSRSGAAIHVAADKRYLGHILISDRIKRGAFDALESLRIQGVKKTVMLTGDVLSVARPIASKLNFDMLRAELLPEEKVAAVEYLISNKGGLGAIAFVGDGINDAAAMACSDLGISMGALGSEKAIEAADVVLLDDRIDRLPLAVKLSKFTAQVTRFNIILTLFTKLAVIATGLFGLIPIPIAVSCDIGVLIIAVFNSLRPLKAWRE